MSRLVIAGLGSIGRRHLKNLLDLGAKEIVLLRTKPEPLPDFPELRVVTRIDNALATKPDAVLVCNPTASHIPVAIAAAKAGCRLFIEKPLSHSWTGIEELADLVQKGGSRVFMGFDLRFDPGLLKAKELIEAGEIGRVTSLQAGVGQYLPDWHPQEDYRVGHSARVASGGGVVLDLIHELDYVSWLAGGATEVVAVTDRVSSLEIETEDTAAILLRFQSGAIGTVNLDYVQRVPSRECRIVGDEGTIRWDYFQNRIAWFQASRGTWQEFAYPGFARNDRFRLEMAAFLRWLAGDPAPVADLEVGVRTLQLALAVKESARSGKRISVKSDWPHDHQ